MSPKTARTNKAAARRAAAEPPTPPATAPDGSPSWGMRLRELVDELVFVFVIVMFMKMFLVELYKIPTGSMTPTLLGGAVAEVDFNNDGRNDLVYYESQGNEPILDRGGLVFLNDGARRTLALGQRPSPEQTGRWLREGKLRSVYDRILVNKLVYWFHQPRRGEVVVFKVPDPPFRPEAPIYIKRLAGEPGERLSFLPDPATGGELGQLAVDGRAVTQPDFFNVWRYRPTVNVNYNSYVGLPYVRYADQPYGERRLVRIDVPRGMVFMLGDNTEGSLDSRYWGGVPLANLKGRAFFRILPFRRFGWIR
jgi:signal peptidase I